MSSFVNSGDLILFEKLEEMKWIQENICALIFRAENDPSTQSSSRNLVKKSAFSYFFPCIILLVFLMLDRLVLSVMELGLKKRE